ncbi:hypothetical protein DV736_g6421, partial [Chaetothyriales sp. CBS 134916]
KQIASGSYDNTIKLWDTTTGNLQKTLAGHFDWVRAVAFSPDGKQIASGSDDETIKLWDVAKCLKASRWLGGTLGSRLKFHAYQKTKTPGPVNTLKFSADGQYLVTDLGPINVRSRMQGIDPDLLHELYVKKQWIYYGPAAVFYLPPDYQQSSHDVQGNQVTIGFTNGRQLHGVALQSQREDAQYRRSMQLSLKRDWQTGDVYAPHDLSAAEMRKWGKKQQPTRDVFDIMSVNPLSLYKNFSVMSDFVSEMGRIRPARETGLRPVNQRKIAKAVRRAIAMGLMPTPRLPSKPPTSPSKQSSCLPDRCNSSPVPPTAMSISPAAVYAALPTTSRGQPTPLSADSKGQRLAYASGKSVFLRSLDNPAVATQYTQHTAPTTVARFAPSGFYVASGDASGIVRVWDSTANGCGTTKGEYAIISGRINDISWDGDSQRIIAVGDGKQRYGHCVTADSGNTVGEISGHSAQVNAVSIRQQRPLRAATAGDDKNVVFYHGAPFKFNDIPGRGTHANFIYGLAFSPDGSHLVSVGADRKIVLYDGKTGALQTELSSASHGHGGSIFAVSWSSDSRSLVTSSADRTVKVWDVEAAKVKHTWTFGDTASVNHQQVGVVWPGGRTDGLIISLSLNGQLNYLNTSSAKPTRVVYDGRLCAWDAATGTAEPVDGDGHTNIISGLAATPSSSSYSTTKHPQIFSVAWDDSLRTVDAAAKTFTGTSTHLSSQPKALTATADSLVVVAQVDSVLVYRDGSEDGELPLPASPSALAASGTTVAIGAADSSLRLFAVVPGKAPRQVAIVDKVSATPITALAFSPDGSLLAAGTAAGKIYGAVSGSLDTNIFVWSLKEPGKRVKHTNAHKEGVNAVAWLADGGSVYSVGADAAVKKWHVVIA